MISFALGTIDVGLSRVSFMSAGKRSGLFPISPLLQIYTLFVRFFSTFNMGWFWADTPAASAAPAIPHAPTGASPPVRLPSLFETRSGLTVLYF